MRLLLLLVLLAAPAFAQDLQSEGRNAVARDRRVDIEHLVLDVAIDIEAGRVEGTATHTVRPLRQGLEEIVFDQIQLAVERVTIDGAEAPFTLEPTQLRIQTPPLELGRSYSVATTWSAAPTNGLHFRRAPPSGHDAYDEAWTQGEQQDHRHWFPSWDGPRDRFTFEAWISVPERFTAVSNGTLTERVVDAARPGWQRWHWALQGGDLVNYLVMLAVGPYERHEAAWSGGTLSTFVPPDTDPEVARITVARTAEMMDVLGAKTGVPYPYGDYNQVFIQRFLYTGMENTAATILDARLLHGADVHDNRRRAEWVIAHELGHQWYGDQLTCRTWREMWLNEGFATFASQLWAEHSWGAIEGARATWGRYRSVVRADGDKPAPLVRRFYNQANGERAANPYSKGSSVLQMLRVMLGEDAFLRGFARYTREHQHGLVETVDVRRAFEEESGLHLGWFFDQWVYLPGHPVLKVTAKPDREAGVLRLDLEQTQATDGATPVFTLPLDVEVATEAGSTVHRIWMDSASATASVPLDGALSWLSVDPLGGLLAEIEVNQTASAWLAVVQGSEHPYARVDALERLGKVTPDEAVRSALIAMTADDQLDTTLRALAISVLAAWKSDADFDALIAVLGGTEPALRERAADKLGESLPRKAVIDALDKALREDTVVDVRAGALESLGRLEGDAVRRRAFAVLRSAASEQHFLQATAAQTLGRWGRAEDVAALEALRARGVTHNARMAAFDASLELIDKAPVADREALRRSLRRDAERMLADRHLRARQKAISVLGRAGDDRSVRALQAARAREHTASVQRAIDGSIEAIRARRDSEPDPTDGELKAKLKGLVERLDRAEQELKALQERH